MVKYKIYQINRYNGCVSASYEFDDLAKAEKEALKWAKHLEYGDKVMLVQVETTQIRKYVRRKRQVISIEGGTL